MSIFSGSDVDLDHAPTPAQAPDLDALASVDTRARKLLASIPMPVKRAGLPFEYIRTGLRGRDGVAPGARELSKALRRIGWIPRRNWHLQYPEHGAIVLWYPPGIEPVKEMATARLEMRRGRIPKWIEYVRNRAEQEGRYL